MLKFNDLITNSSTCPPLERISVFPGRYACCPFEEPEETGHTLPKHTCWMARLLWRIPVVPARNFVRRKDYSEKKPHSFFSFWREKTEPRACFFKKHGDFLKNHGDFLKNHGDFFENHGDFFLEAS